jgi:hypothetical protein
MIKPSRKNAFSSLQAIESKQDACKAFFAKKGRIPSRLTDLRLGLFPIPRYGLTMLEVIFSMVVILVGLVSVGLLIPLAGRQAADSYQITQGLAAGESAVSMLNTSEITQPGSVSPWCFYDEAGNISHKVESIRNAYNLLGLGLDPPQSHIEACESQNRVAGYGFCFDPLFWGNQLPDPLPPPFVKTNFPCLNANFNPADIGNPNPPAYAGSVPRLVRVSAWNPSLQVVDLSTQQRPGLAFIPGPAAVRLATLHGGDLAQISPSANKALGPLKLMYPSPQASGRALLGSPVAPDTPSWIMMLTPSVSTPLQPVSVTTENFIQNERTSNQPVRIPTLFDASIIVFAKRDVRDINANMSAAAQNFPNSERILRVSDINAEALTSGTFNLTLQGSSFVNPRVKIGDWLMLSRWTQEAIPQATQFTKRQVHRWYRIIGIEGEDTFPVSVRVTGAPWNWTEDEVRLWARSFGTQPTGPPGPNVVVPPNSPPFEVHATLLRDVVHVYERQIELQ